MPSSCQTEEAEKKVKKRCELLNDYICNRARISSDIPYLASPVIGGAIALGRFDQLFTLLFKENKRDVETLAAETWSIILAQGQRLIKEGKTLESAEENIDELKSMAERFLDTRLPIIKALQII